ncbi:MAG: M3 family metallopeptidase [Firmicutes bacterium]|nr:M3 family metallopeptidase [Bacillota bacterium]
MKKRKLSVLIVLLLALSLLLQGCTVQQLFREGGFPAPTEATETTGKPTEAPTEPEDLPPYTPYDEYERPAEALLAEVPFDEIVYERPDAQGLCDDFAAVQALVEDGADCDAILAAYYPVEETYVRFSTMGQYAYIRYTLDLNDSYYDEEYNWCEEQSPLIEQAMEKCFIAMGKSDQRKALEAAYFEEGFFDYYDENQIYSNDRVVELMQEESALQSEYMAMQSDMTIAWEGEECIVEDLLADPNLDYMEMLEIYTLYYEKYNPLASELFAKLIRVRREIAEELDYESYADFAYEYYYERDYTPAQVKQYTSDIAKEMASLYYAAVYGSYSEDMEMDEVMELLQNTAYRFGGEIATAYDYMMAYRLYDVTESTSKMPGSYMTYLSAYEMPFLYVSPTGEIDDFLTATHEFGHFVDGYVNCNGTNSIDCAEIFSQGLEFLALSRADLTRREREGLTSSKLADSVLVFLGQACYAEFEQRAYELPDDELTAERLNALFLECTEEFGMSMYGMEDILAPGWIDIQHFFIAPFYVISYCVSNDAALQIYMLEQENGSGMEAYQTLMRNAPDNSILALLKIAEMESPFAEGRIAELADFFADNLE